MFSFVSFLCCFCLHITEYEQIRKGEHIFLGPGRKIPKYGPGSRTIPCIFRCAVYIRCTVSIQQVRENGKILGARYT
jgi:hypothetical protein